jgi:hypothetical protein
VGTVRSGAQTDASPEARQVVWPDEPAARRAESFLEAYNTGGEGAFRGFIKEQYSKSALDEEPLERKLADYLKVRRMLGKLTGHSAKGDGDFTLEVMVHSRMRGDWGKFRFELSPTPNEITVMSSNQSAPPDPKSAEEYRDRRGRHDLLEQINRFHAVKRLVGRFRR